MRLSGPFRSLPALVVVLLLAGGARLSAGLEPGQKAPALEITKWVKGESVDLAKVAEGKEGKVVVVEFWATWCGPCILSIPHLSELQKKHAKEVVVIGVTKPDPRNTLRAVEGFVETQGDKMGYTVAFDGDAKTYEAYMTAAGQRGIPTAFIVDKKGVLSWIGHPMTMDRPLAEIVAGTFDIEKERKRQEVLQKARTLRGALVSSAQEGDIEAAGKTAGEIVGIANDDASILNDVAWMLLTHPKLEGKLVELALKAAERCDELSESSNWMYIDTLALARFESGKAKDAVALQKKAIELARKDDARPETLKQLEERLERFEKPLE